MPSKYLLTFLVPATPEQAISLVHVFALFLWIFLEEGIKNEITSGESKEKVGWIMSAYRRISNQCSNTSDQKLEMDKKFLLVFSFALCDLHYLF